MTTTAFNLAGATPQEAHARFLVIMAALTKKQRDFVNSYVGEAMGNATEAARLARYTSRSCAKAGSENLRKPHIQEAIQCFWASRGISVTEIQARVAAIARGNLGAFVAFRKQEGETGATHQPYIDLRKAHEAKAFGLLKKLEIKADGSIVLQLHDPLKALDMLSRMCGLYQDKEQESGDPGLTADDIADLLQAVDIPDDADPLTARPLSPGPPIA